MSIVSLAQVTAGDAIAGFDGAIKTARLTLRPPVAADAEPMFAHFNDWDVVRWLARPKWPQALEMMAGHLAASPGEKAAGRALLLTILVDGQPAGNISWNIRSNVSHMGYWIGKPFWGRGYMSEAAAALCDLIFTTSHEAAIYSGVFEGNIASLRIQEKIGFIQVGRSKFFSVPVGGELTHLDTKLTRTARSVVLEKATT